MSGHSKWANIKHRKGAADAKRGKIFSKLAREITLAAKSGGSPESNPTLRLLIQKARGVNMPADNIDRAIKKGTGELQADVMEEIFFEGYAPGGVALIVHVLTDNRNRTVAEVRHLFNKYGGNVGTQGSVMRSFQRKGEITVPAERVDEERLMELVLEAGAEDLQHEDDLFEIITDPSSYVAVMEALQKEGIATERSQVGLVPDLLVPVTDKARAQSLVTFFEELEDLDDVQNVYSNADIDPKLLEL